MGSLLARAYKRILSGKLAQDAGEHWVTVNAGSKEGGEGGGSHVLLDGEGRVVAGMGGKFKGQNIDRIERKKFINQNAWNRQRKALTEKAGDDTQLKRVVTAGMRSQAEKEADKSNDTWQKEGLYNALVRRTQRENRGMINVLHDHLDYKNAQPKTPNPIAEKIQKQSDGVKQIVTEAITKYNDLEAVNQLHDIPDGVNVVTEKGQFFKTGDLWSSPDGKKTLEHDQMFRQLKKELKGQISNKDMDNLMTNELEKVQYKDIAERVKDIDPQLAKEIENTEKKYNKLKAENIAKAERSEHEKKKGGGHAISFEEQNTEKKLQELKAQAEAKIAEAPKAEEQPRGKLYDYHEVTNLSDKAYKERAKLVKEMRNLNVNNPGEELTISKYGRTFKRIPDLEGNINTNWGEVGRTGEIYKREYAYKAAPDNNEEREEYKNWKERRAQWLRNAGIDPSDIDNRPLYFYDKATNTESFYNAYDPNGTWSKYDDNLPEKDYKFFKEAKQRAKDAGLAVKEEQLRGMKNAFSDKYQKIDNSNLNKYQKVDNISNNKNTEHGVTNMNTNQESQAKTYEGNKLASYYNQQGVKALENANEQEHVKINGEAYVKQTDGSWTNPETKATASTNQIADKLNKVISKSLEEQYSGNPFNLHALRGGSMHISPSAHNGQQSAVVKFFNKPEQSTIDMLKQNGFKWMQSKKSWVHNGEIGNKSHLDVLKALKGVAPAPQTSQATPTAQPRQATPTQQAEGKQYHGTGIENKNGRFEVSFNAFPSYELRTDMKNNGFRWDPNAKVWHTTDREKLDKVMSKHFTERT